MARNKKRRPSHGAAKQYGAAPSSQNGAAYARNAGSDSFARPSLPRTGDGRIVSDAPNVSPVKATDDVPRYPSVVIGGGGSAWSFEGLGEDLYPSPYMLRWPNGYVPSPVRQQMMLHPKVSQQVWNLKSAIVGDGGRCIPAVSPYGPEKADFAKALEICQFCEYAIRNKKGSYFTTTFQMADAITEGNKVAPIVLRDETEGPYKNRRVLDKLHVWPTNSYTFYRDRFGNTTDLEVPSPGDGAGSVGMRRFAREKFFVTTFRPVNDNPIGTSVLAAAYDPWYKDVHLDTELMSYIAAFARPSIFIFAAPPPEGRVETAAPLYWKDGTPVMERDATTGTLKHRKGYQSEQNNLTFGDYKGGSTYALEFGALVEIQEASQGGADLFRLMREENAKEMASAIFGTHLLTEGTRTVSTGGADMSSQVAQLNVSYGKKMMEEAEENDLLGLIVEQNFGKSYRYLTPIRDYGSGQNSRIQTQQLNGFVGFATNGALTMNQWWWLCAGNGWPLPYPDDKPITVRVQELAPKPPPGANGDRRVAGTRPEPKPKTGGADKTGE